MAEREFRTTPQWPIATTPLSGDELVEVWKGGKQYYVPFSELGGMPAAHSGTHKHGGDDEVGTLDNLAYEIPKLDADGLIDSRVSDASTTTKGIVQLATDGEEDATKAVNGTDSRLKDARPPTAHAAQHIAGTDVIADATVSNSGLMSAADKVKADATIPACIPTADQKAALAGSYGTPSAVNRFVTESDPVLSSGGGGGGTTGVDLLGIGKIGNGVSILIKTSQSLAYLSVTEVALFNSSNNLAKYSFDGSDWSLVGNVLSISGFSSHSCIGPLTSTDIVLYNETSKELATYRFDGTNWAKHGNGLSLPLASTSSTIAKLSSSEIAIRDGSKLAKYSFDGSDWSLVGNVLDLVSLGINGNGGVSALTSTDVAMVSEPYEKLGSFRFDGTNWSKIGVFLDMPGIDNTSIASINSTDIALIDDGLEQLSIYRFNGSVWAKGGNSLTISGTYYPSIAMLTESTVALVSSNNGKLRTYNFLFGYDSASVNIAADYEVPEIATGKSIVIRRTSAYDGNPVTISPPSGATFEGLASLSLYDQYSYVELERISSTVFAMVWPDSGLDAALLGGLDSSRFAEARGLVSTGDVTAAMTKSGMYIGTGETTNAPSGGLYCYFTNYFDVNTSVIIAIRVATGETFINRKLSGTWVGWSKSWNEDNDGSGSGLETDKIPFATKTGTSTGSKGQASFDANYLYLCTATNVWKRVALTSF